MEMRQWTREFSSKAFSLLCDWVIETIGPQALPVDTWSRRTLIPPLWSVVADHRKHLKWPTDQPHTLWQPAGGAGGWSSGLLVIGSFLAFEAGKKVFSRHISILLHSLPLFMLLPGFCKTNLGLLYPLTLWWKVMVVVSAWLSANLSNKVAMSELISFGRLVSCWLRSKAQLQWMLNMCMPIYKHMVFYSLPGICQNLYTTKHPLASGMATYMT